ncbi:MarR family transcriptional regulator [Marinospirillum alkaliphilum]|uniref:DNA-binding transcriptional regulator, MarR family n=1 Tax=Marinospirillum alkaliphilum DSM 21637 TaxID=1122209 RepID=A0A1K1TGV8_9GAMM|nr:MarR family transcriptional regulator [Marinospirillum alkaliphilum]SFW99774.1 DNA-binding transcriptional regulator, MarR family [Marinospirillum alkaliphilum DSM 21637]
MDPVNSRTTSPSTILLDDLLGYALRRAQLKAFQCVVEAFEPYDLRPAQFSALAILEQNPGIMQADLAKALAIEPPQAVVLVNKLEQRNLALRIRSQTDRRSYGLYLSRQGEKLLNELKEIAQRCDLETTAALSDCEREELLRLLKKLCLS